jgi:tetratricopeptide (TPR) repeat protein
MINVNLSDERSKEIYKDLQIKALNSLLIDPTYAMSASMNLVNAGYVNEGVGFAKKILLKDSRNLDALNSLALINEKLGEFKIAIDYRQKILKLDPWNASNLLYLGQDYKQLGDLVRTKEILEEILSFASGNKIGDQAKIDLAT